MAEQDSCTVGPNQVLFKEVWVCELTQARELDKKLGLFSASQDSSFPQLENC